MFDFIARPFGWLLMQIYNLTGSYGIALIIFTLIAKLVLLPFQMKSKKSMIGMQKIQPKMKELEKKYKDDKERYALAVQQLYKDEEVSMMGGCLPLLLTFPIMLGLYAVVRQPLTFMFGMEETAIEALAQQIGIVMQGPASNYEIQIAATLGKIDFSFLGIDLSATPSFAKFNILWIIPILSGITSYLVSWVSKKSQPAPTNGQENPAGMMTMLMPIMSVWIAFIVPGGLGFYWVVNNLLSAIQEPVLQWYYTKFKPIKKEGKK
ncbi:MAG: YidC/Oxa1 family membrane protein insertase [Clostridia bacterium]|nr:YidC/Oxa1 family membrane protein insertase [Clostridia bacterium]